MLTTYLAAVLLHMSSPSAQEFVMLSNDPTPPIHENCTTCGGKKKKKKHKH